MIRLPPLEPGSSEISWCSRGPSCARNLTSHGFRTALPAVRKKKSKEKPSYKNRKYCEFYNWVFFFIACLQGSVSYKRRFHSGKSHRNPLRNPLCTPLRTSGQIKNTPEIIFRSMQIIIRQIFINFLKDIPDFIVTRICLILLPFSCLLQSAF